MRRRDKVLARSAISAAVGAVVLSIGSSSAQAQTYTVTNIGAQIASNGYGSAATGINSSDQVVGYYNSTARSGAELPFVYTPGSGAVTIPNVSAYFQTQASAINNAGIVVGDGLVNGDGLSGAQEGFVYNANTGSFAGVAPIAAVSGTDIPNLNLTSINNSGVAVGYSYTNSSAASYRAVTYNVSSGVLTNIGDSFSGPVTSANSSGNSNQAFGINDSGVIAGYGPNTGGVSSQSTTGDLYYATPTSGGTYPTASFTDITTAVKAAPNNTYAGPFNSGEFVDSAGNVAGDYTSKSGNSSYAGFLYVAGTNTAFNIDNGSQRTIVEGIADVNGVVDVVGQTLSFPSVPHAFIYTYANGAGTFNDESGLVSGYTLSAINGVNSKGDLVATGTPTAGGNSQALLLTLPAVVTDYYFTGATNSSWATQPNFAATHTGATAQGPIASGSNVFLTADSASHAGSQTLDGSYTLNSLTFTGTSTAGAGLPISLAPGSGGTLTITAANAFTATTAAGSTNYAAGIGMVVQSGSGGDTISAPIVLGNSQSWEVDAGGTLTVTGGVSDGGAGNSLTITSSGLATLGGTSTYSGATNVAGGTLNVTGTLANSGTVTLNGSSNLVLGGANALPSTATVNIGANANAYVNAGQTLASISNAGNATFSTGSSIVGQGNGIGTGAGGASTTGGFTGTGTLNVTGGSLTAATIRQATLNVGNGASVAIADSTLPAAVGLSVSSNTAATSVLTDLLFNGANFTTSATGSVDLKNNDMIINDASQHAYLISAIAHAYDNGNWDMSGITSSSAAANHTVYGLGYATGAELGTTSFDGQPITSGSTVVKYTLLGDTTLKGAVTGGDYSTVVANFGKTGQDWSQGNFFNVTSGPSVTGSDYSTVVANFGKTASGNVVSAMASPALTRAVTPDVQQGSVNDMHLEVNTSTGDVQLLAETTMTLSLYAVYDSSSNLRTGQWHKLSTGTATASTGVTYTPANWAVAGNSSGALGEGQNQGAYNSTIPSTFDNISLAAGQTIDLGNIFKTTTNSHTLSFEFQEPNASTGDPVNGYQDFLNGTTIDYIGGSTPEPASLGILGLGALALGRRRRPLAMPTFA